MIVDSHHHLWAYEPAQYPWIDDEKAVLRRDFGAAELRKLAAEQKIDGFVTVQARQSVAETDALLAIARDEPLVRGVVGWLPLAESTLAESLDRFAAEPLLRGVRHVVQDEPAGFLDAAAFNRGVSQLADRGLVFDLLIFGRQLPEAIRFVDRHRDVSIVLNHIAKPTIHSAFDDVWAAGIRELARRDHVTCKFSGVATEVRGGGWSTEIVRPYWDVVLDSFTPSRMMFGSDWPVCLLATDYGRWRRAVTEWTSTFSPNEQTAFWSANATRVYGLPNESPTRPGSETSTVSIVKSLGN